MSGANCHDTRQHIHRRSRRLADSDVGLRQPAGRPAGRLADYGGTTGGTTGITGPTGGWMEHHAVYDAGTRTYLLVFQASYNGKDLVWGQFFDEAGVKLHSQPFLISKGSGYEYLGYIPRVAASGDGRFLVSYAGIDSGFSRFVQAVEYRRGRAGGRAGEGGRKHQPSQRRCRLAAADAALHGDVDQVRRRGPLRTGSVGHARDMGWRARHRTADHSSGINGNQPVDVSGACRRFGRQRDGGRLP